jgi:predicted phosphodiesterase
MSMEAWLKEYEIALIELIRICAKDLGTTPRKVSFAKFTKFLETYDVGDRIEGVEQLDAPLFVAFRDSKLPRSVQEYDLLLSETKAEAKVEKKFFTNAVAEETFLTRLARTNKIWANKIVPAGYSVKAHGSMEIERHLNLFLSDLHFGALLDGREVPHRYGPNEEARRLAKVIKETIDFKPQYRKNTVLNVTLGGDIIQNKIHNDFNSAPLADQVNASIYLLLQALGLLAQHFPKVHVRCTGGNHDRFETVHPKKMVHFKINNLATTIYFALQMATAHLKNVTFEIPYTPYITYKSFDKRFFHTHGDTVFEVGVPGSNINTASLEKQVNRINTAQPKGEEFDLFCVGHVHTPTILHLTNRVKVITNGSLIGVDSYGLSIGFFENANGQQLWESVEGYALGDSRFLSVDEYTDKDQSLERIIRPYSGLQSVP